MPNYNDLAQGLERIKANIVDISFDNMSIAGFDMKATVVKRVGNQRVDTEGKSFGRYSESYYKRRVRDKKINSNSREINFSATNQLLNSVATDPPTINDSILSVGIRPSDQERQAIGNKVRLTNQELYNRLVDLQKRKGRSTKILELSKQEADEILQDMAERIFEELINLL